LKFWINLKKLSQNQPECARPSTMVRFAQT
jgi:hypothetical protein